MNINLPKNSRNHNRNNVNNTVSGSTFLTTDKK